MLGKFCRIPLLVIDEIGYMSYSNKYADLLYEVISGRYQKRPTIVTTNTAFKLWGEIFPNAACVVTLVDQLVHHSEIVTIEGLSWRHHEAEERALAKEQQAQKQGCAAEAKVAVALVGCILSQHVRGLKCHRSLMLQIGRTFTRVFADRE